MTLVSLFAAAALMISPAQTDRAAPTVRVAQGALVGVAADGVESFKSVPFAAPPVGPLRWRMPQPAAAWEGERSATDYGAICIQPPSNGDPGVGPLPMSEDCLTLNVWRPEARGDRPLPVMVWIHGGGLNNGSGTAALYDGSNLARRGVVVVTVNYRLGRLGFFDHPALAAERERGEPAANYGFMDVIAALAWVRDNAEAFGGDPGNVTIFGESAGGTIVTRLMISTPARGLFHRAVVQSGLGRDEGTPLDQPRRDGGPSMRERGEAFVQSLSLEGATADQLRNIPAAKLLTPAPNFYGGDLLLRDGDRPAPALTFHRTVEPHSMGAQLLPSTDGPSVWVDLTPVIDGRHLVNVSVTTDASNRPAIAFRFDGEGARRFGRFTAANVGKRFAIVLEGKVISAPTVMTPITGGSGIIEGQFTVGEASTMVRLISGDLREPAVFVPEDVEAAFAAGRAAPVPLIIGTNSAEFWWMKPSDLSPYGAIDDAMTNEERRAFLEAYGGEGGYDAHVLSDLVFNEPARHLARLHAANGHPTYLYRFDVVPESNPEPSGGATHASERPYVFDNLHTVGRPIGARDERAARAMADYWTTFAAKGNPNGPGRPAWPEFGAEPDRLLEFTNDGPAARPIPNAERLDLIERFYTRIR
ncbi:carboxylesterase family protein [Brevundimonas sp. UBA2416]|uniref:carboxylesterase family protein n=1 Tax=Brevundimonas sp. UBA2416 TaxID=1946124 RepID=UPI0025B7EB65|nr:carboxylesterase family protein [Brevundimonas sp. UBA2416]